jgi:hypothetical protein
MSRKSDTAVTAKASSVHRALQRRACSAMVHPDQAAPPDRRAHRKHQMKTIALIDRSRVHNTVPTRRKERDSDKMKGFSVLHYLGKICAEKLWGADRLHHTFSPCRRHLLKIGS